MKKGEVWLVELPSVDGHEQAGTRPAIVLAEAEADIALIVPFTSNLQALRFPNAIEVKPSERNGLSVISVALVFQARAIDKKRLKTKIGELEAQPLDKLDALLRRLLLL